MNETLQSIHKRYSCRAFADRVPTDDQLRTIAEAALAAPSGMNRQAWRVIVVKDRALMREMEDEALRAMREMEDQTIYKRILSRGGTVFYHAPCMIMVPIDPKEFTGAVMDCGILCQNIALSAQSLGLAGCICGLSGLAFAGNKAETFMRRLRFPEGFAFGASVLLGYAQAEGTPHAMDPSKVFWIE